MTDKTENIDEMEDDTIVFADENGNEIEFTEVATFEYKDKWYSALTPVQPTEGWSDEGDEVIFCEITEDKEGYETFEIVENEELMNNLIEELNNLPEEDEEE